MTEFHAERLPLAGFDRMRMRIYSIIAGAVLVTALLALLK